MGAVHRVAPLAVVLLLALAGCGGDDDEKNASTGPTTAAAKGQKRAPRPKATGSDAEAVAKAGLKTAEAGTAEVAMTVELPPPDAVRGSGAGVVDFERDRTRLAMSFETGGRRSDAELFLGGGRQLVRLAPNGTWQVGDTGPSFQITSLGALAEIGEVVVEVKRDGSGRVRGAECERYEAQLDLERAALAVPEDQRAEYRAGTRAFKTHLIPTEIFVGRDGRICRQRIELTDDQVELQGRRAAFEYDLYGFGRPKTPVVPKVGARN
jgi:hypothetical protein